MYKCCDCGNIFEEGEQAVWSETHGLYSPPYEKWSGCPVCKGWYEEANQCKECGDWYTHDELYRGLCENCIRETINYDTFLEYCESDIEDNDIETFVMFYLLNCDEVPKYPSWEFHQLMVETYKRRVSDAKILGGRFDFLEDCIQFIMHDYGSIGIENYADWLNKREVK